MRHDVDKKPLNSLEIAKIEMYRRKIEFDYKKKGLPFGSPF